MVCKEDVLSWFKDLEGYKRIDVMYELLNMCVPFEIRFLGSCIEEIGKHSYQELRGPAIAANDVEKLSKDANLTQGLLDDAARHRVVLYVSLLNTRNYTCANWLYKTVFRTDCTNELVKGNFKDENVLGELLLLFTMCLHHPAFTFEQKCFFGETLSALVECRKRENRLSAKSSLFYPPPGIPFPSQKVPNVPDVPVKTAMPVQHHGDTVLHHGHPPGIPIPAIPPGPIEILTAPHWSRPGFMGTVCGAPDVAPFPSQPISPIVSQANSPIQSRSTSPHRTVNVRPPVAPIPQPANPPLEVLPHLPPVDPLSHSSLPLFSSELKLPEDELNHIEEKPWASPLVVHMDPKPINGLRFSPYTKLPQQQSFLIEQLQSLNLDGESSLHHSNSSSSSSLNHSPPGTPTVTTPHGPGRGPDVKPRLNGVPPPQPPYIPAPPPSQSAPPLCETTPTPPPLPPTLAANCSVPYVSYPVPPPPPNSRSIFQYRPPQFQFPNQSDFISYTVPYVSYVYSSPLQYPQRLTPNCYNCGGQGHLGGECREQTIEDITQKKTYSLEYVTGTPDSESK